MRCRGRNNDVKNLALCEWAGPVHHDGDVNVSKSIEVGAIRLLTEEPSESSLMN